MVYNATIVDRPLRSSILIRPEDAGKESSMDFLFRVNKTVNKVLTLIGGLLLVAMIILTCTNIVLRQIYVPVRGTFELMGFTGAVVTAFALGYTQWTNGHISVDILVNAYPAPLKRIVQIINSFACCVFFFIGHLACI